MKQGVKGKRKPGVSYLNLILGYICFCLITLITVAVTLSRYISKNNTEQINNILSLMSEKVNTSFEMMTDYITEVADLISAQQEISFEDNYREIQDTLVNMPYFSIGMIGPNGEVYGSPGEKMDIDRQDFVVKTEEIDDIYISEPYRSSVTGSNMITIFSPVFQDGEKVGCVFVSYYLETIQNLAYTNILSDETAVFLMNPYSGNFVNCSMDGANPPGTWSNVRLIKKDIACYRGYDYDRWLANMRVNDADNIINFRHNNIAYTQAYISISGMSNWNLVIRIPIAELSSTMHQYTTSVIICAAILVLATLLLAVTLFRREHDKTKLLKNLSDTDPLTKVMNRRGFNNTLTKIFSEKENLEECTFLFIDVDFFKEVNDHYGHAAGDHVLCSAANILKEVFGETGIVARMGGDEFNVLIPYPLTVEEMDTLLATIRMKFNEIRLPDKTPLPISFSAGLSVYPKDATESKTLIECADKALYYVKENGRKNHFWYSDLKEKDENKDKAESKEKTENKEKTKNKEKKIEKTENKENKE